MKNRTNDTPIRRGSPYWFWFMNIWLFSKMVDLDIFILLLLHTYYLLWYSYILCFVCLCFFFSLYNPYFVDVFLWISLFICLLLYYLCTLHEIFLKISKISSVFYRVLNKLIVWNWKKKIKQWLNMTFTQNHHSMLVEILNKKVIFFFKSSGMLLKIQK